MNRCLLALATFFLAMLSITDTARAEDRRQEREIAQQEAMLDRADLHDLAGIGLEQPLEGATLDRITDKMAAGMDSFEASSIRTILEQYQKHSPLPDKTFYFLVEFMVGLSEISYVAADALELTPIDDVRRTDAIVALENRLRSAANDQEVLYTIAYLERFARHGPLLDSSVVALIKVVDSPLEFGLRKRALELTLSQETSEAQKRKMFNVLLDELDTSMDPYSREALSSRNSNREFDFILRTLVSLANRPHSPPFIDVLIAHFLRYKELGLPLIVEFSGQQGLSEIQTKTLSRWTTTKWTLFTKDIDRQIEMRKALFNMLWLTPDEDVASLAMQEFDAARSFPARCRALYDISRFYADAPLPGATAKWLYRAMLNNQDTELRHTGASMLLSSSMSVDVRKRWVLDLVAQGHREEQLHDLLLDTYDTASLQNFLNSHASDLTLPALFRTSAIRRLGAMASPGADLPVETIRALTHTAQTDKEMPIGTAEDALRAWGIEPPVSDRQKERQRRNTMGTIADSSFLVMTWLAPVVFLYGFIAIPAAKAVNVAKSSGIGWSIAGWILLAVLVSIAWLYGLVFSFGLHGNGAPTQEHFGIMMPFYLLVTAMIAIAGFATRRIFKSHLSRRASALGQ